MTVRHTVHSKYRCPECGHEWEGDWDSACDDDCPECGCRHISPYEYDRIGLFAVVNCVEGRAMGVTLHDSQEDAIQAAADSAAEQCDTAMDAIVEELREDLSFESNNGDIVLTIWDVPVPG